MHDRWKSVRRAACIAMVVLALGCRVPEESKDAEDLPLEVQVWNNLRVIPESIGASGFQIEGLPPGWRARLVPWHTQGINPRILFAQLELVPGEPSTDEDAEAVTAEAATWVECNFSYEEVWVVTPEGWIELPGSLSGRS